MLDTCIFLIALSRRAAPDASVLVVQEHRPVLPAPQEHIPTLQVKAHARLPAQSEEGHHVTAIFLALWDWAVQGL